MASVTNYWITSAPQEIMQEYPDAKVVLTVRDPDSWWSSIKDTIHHKSLSVRASWGESSVIGP